MSQKNSKSIKATRFYQIIIDKCDWLIIAMPWNLIKNNWGTVTHTIWHVKIEVLESDK